MRLSFNKIFGFLRLWIFFCLFIFVFWAHLLSPGHAQEVPEDKKDEAAEEEAAPSIEDSGFINYGLLSISIGYEITTDKKHIIFKIINNTGQTIDSVFGWVYKVQKGENENTAKVFLINKPNTSGILVSKHPHKPAEMGTWRFTLKRKNSPENATYLLRVNDRSIFYVPFVYPEPPPRTVEEVPEEGEGEAKEPEQS